MTELMKDWRFIDFYLDDGIKKLPHILQNIEGLFGSTVATDQWYRITDDLHVLSCRCYDVASQVAFIRRLGYSVGMIVAPTTSEHPIWVRYKNVRLQGVIRPTMETPADYSQSEDCYEARVRGLNTVAYGKSVHDAYKAMLELVSSCSSTSPDLLSLGRDYFAEVARRIHFWRKGEEKSPIEVIKLLRTEFDLTLTEARAALNSFDPEARALDLTEAFFDLLEGDLAPYEGDAPEGVKAAWPSEEADDDPWWGLI